MLHDKDEDRKVAVVYEDDEENERSNSAILAKAEDRAKEEVDDENIDYLVEDKIQKKENQVEDNDEDAPIDVEADD